MDDPHFQLFCAAFIRQISKALREGYGPIPVRDREAAAQEVIEIRIWTSEGHGTGIPLGLTMTALLTQAGFRVQMGHTGPEAEVEQGCNELKGQDGGYFL